MKARRDFTMCRFCDEYNIVKNGMEDFANYSSTSKYFRYDFLVAFVVRTWDSRFSTKHASNVIKNKYKIKYCPVCGKKLKKSKKKVEVVSE